MNRGGLTLIEILAATVLLGLLAATVIPMQSRWNEHLRRAEQRATAEDALGLVLARPTHPPTTQIAGHPDWHIERILVSAVGALPAPQRTQGYQWVRVIIRDNANAVLAETLMVQIGQR